MESHAVSFEECQKTNLAGRSMNYMRLKEMRKRATSSGTFIDLQENPYLEIWDVDYYSTSDEEDNDSDKESSSEEE